MASSGKFKKLESLNEKETETLLSQMKFEKITQKMLSGDYGEATGELLVELDDETLKNDFKIESSLQRKQFLKKLAEYKKGGVPVDLIGTTRASSQMNRSILNNIVSKSNKIEKECTRGLDMYAFPAKKTTVSEYKHSSKMNVKKIIIMGETGTGKSTLLNSIVNFAAGVELDDPFRFKLVTDEVNQAGDQSRSQTTEISGYLIEDTVLGYDLQIWDTPGFGDTAGVERDEEIKEKINQLLKKEDECHAICFVVKASANRLTDVQRYIIDRVLLFFGKEATHNMYLLATFGDVNRPDMLNAIEKSNFPFSEDRWFSFNNADLFKSASRRTPLTRIYWDNTFNSIERFARDVGHQTAFSLSTTKSVIEQREKVKMDIKSITEEVGKAIEIKNTGEENLRKLEAEKGEVERTKKFTRTVTEHVKYPISTKNTTTFCVNCTHTCHEDCAFSDDSDKKRCSAMTDGYCRICPSKCKWDWHTNQPYIYVNKTNNKVEIIDSTKQAHDKAKGQLSGFESIKVQLESESKWAEQKLKGLLGQIRDQFEFLKQTAIITYSIDMYKYFNTLREAEEKRGNSERALEYEKLANEEKIQMQHEDLTVESMIELSRSKIL